MLKSLRVIHRNAGNNTYNPAAITSSSIPYPPKWLKKQQLQVIMYIKGDSTVIITRTYFKAISFMVILFSSAYTIDQQQIMN